MVPNLAQYVTVLAAVFADLRVVLSTLNAVCPLGFGSGSLVAACGAMYLVTRLPEFALLTATAAVYTAVAMMPMAA